MKVFCTFLTLFIYEKNKSSWWVKKNYWVIVIWPELSLAIYGKRLQGNFIQYKGNICWITRKLDTSKIYYFSLSVIFFQLFVYVSIV